MPTSTYDLIASNVLTTGVTSVTFSSIPATYRDLILVFEIDLTSSPDSFRTLSMRFNGDSGANYHYVQMQGTGTAANSNAGTDNTELVFAGNNPRSDDTNRPLYITQILDYSATDKHKTALIRINNTVRSVVAEAGRWASTSAINQITINVSQGDPTNFAAGSTFYLYGIVS